MGRLVAENGGGDLCQLTSLSPAASAAARKFFIKAGPTKAIAEEAPRSVDREIRDIENSLLS
jgi:hypothetical protein